MILVKSRPNKEKEQIASKVRALRQARGMTQKHLAGLLDLSQSRLSEIESGQGSFSAEQFIRVLRTFNVQVSHFDGGERGSTASLQKALARMGAAHLVEDPDLLPSEQLEQVDTVIRETLVEGGAARLLTALAPVLVNHSTRINLNKLYVQFKEYGLESRYAWLLDNVSLAVHETLGDVWPRNIANRLRKAEAVLGNFRIWLHENVQTNANMPPDSLGLAILSAKTREELAIEASAPSVRWNILTAIQVEDFSKAIRESHVP